MNRALAACVALGLVFVLLAGLATSVSAQAQSASAVLRNAAGETVGTATFTQATGGVRVSVQVRNLPPGAHGFHIHAAGHCDPPDFASAGAHFNPEGRQHGLRNPAGPHAGDLPNLQVAATGTGQVTTLDSMVTLGGGSNSLFVPQGTSLVIHANPDDEVTDPSGNSGARIACGVILRAAVAQAPRQLPRTGQGLPLLGLLLPTAALLAGGLYLARGKR